MDGQRRGKELKETKKEDEKIMKKKVIGDREEDIKNEAGNRDITHNNPIHVIDD